MTSLWGYSVSRQGIVIVAKMARPGLQVHPKFRRLVHLLKEPVPHVLGYLECLWGVAYECGDPQIGDQVDVELAAQWPGDQGKLCQALVACRFLDEADGKFSVHDLYDHAPEYVQRRMEREANRRNKGKTISDVRREAAKTRWDANGCKCPTLASGEDANGATPAPTPTPTPAPAPQREDCSEPERPASEPAATDQTRANQNHPQTGVNPRSGRRQDRVGMSNATAQAGDPDPAGDPVVLMFPVVGGKRGQGPTEWPLRESKLKELAEAFPGVDVRQEARKALQWCRDNPTKRKTPGGMPEFLFRWFSRTQNYGGSNNQKMNQGGMSNGRKNRRYQDP